MTADRTAPSKHERRVARRARCQAARQAEARTRRRRRQAAVGGGIVLVLAVAAGGALAVKSQGSGGSAGNAVASAARGPLVVPAHANGTTALVYGHEGAKHTLTVYEDPRCPYCGLLERGLGQEFQRLADRGDYKIEYRIASFLDDGLGGSGSRNAVNALAAASNQGQAQFAALHNEIYKDQPSEKDDAFADNATLLALAARAKGVDQAALQQDVRKGTYVSWAMRLNTNTQSSLDEMWKQNKLPGTPGTPAVFLDGRQLDLLKNSGNGPAPVSAAEYDQQIRDQTRS